MSSRSKQPKLVNSIRVWRKSKKLEKKARENKEASLASERTVGEEKWVIKASQVR